MPAYQLWVLDAAYAKLAYIRDYAQLEYKLVLNGLDWARLEMLPNDAKIAELLQGAHADGFAWGDMAVLCRDKDTRDLCALSLIHISEPTRPY